MCDDQIIDGTRCVWCGEPFTGDDDPRVPVTGASGAAVYAHDGPCHGNAAFVQLTERVLRADGLGDEEIARTRRVCSIVNR